MTDRAEIAEAIYRVLYIVADLRRDLEVYRGFFEAKEDAEILLNGFREIEATLRISISTRLIIGCAALFVDERKSCGKENLSIAALLDRSDSQVTNATKQIWNEITNIVNKMNLKDFRNTRLAHFDYDVLMGNRKIEAVVRSDKLSELLGLTEDLLHQLSSDIDYNDGAKSFFYSKIDSARSPQEFLRRISRSAR